MILLKNENFTVSLVSETALPAASPLPPYRAKDPQPVLSALGRLAAGELFALYYRETVGGDPSGVLVERLQVETGEFGKPFLPAYPDFFYNISHSGAFAVAVYSPSVPVGIDIERIGAYRPGVAKRCFSEEERTWLAALPEPERDAAFTLLWTKKEAAAKAAGVGLTQTYRAEAYCTVDLSAFSPAGYKLSAAYRKTDGGALIPPVGETREPTESS